MATETILIRHGQTEWSKNGRHTSVTDLDLLPEGVEAARCLAPILRDHHFDSIWSSPRLRAQATARLALPDAKPTIFEELAEWNYGEYEGVTSAEIHQTVPDWDLWTDGAPGGETPAQVTERVDEVCRRLLAEDGKAIIFAHGHILRALAVRWLGLDIAWGRSFVLSTATMSILGHEGGRPTLNSWNARP